MAGGGSTERLRVLAIGNMYPPHSLGGYELLWRSAVRVLRSSGMEVRVLCSDHRSGEDTGEADDPDVHRELRWYRPYEGAPRITRIGRVRLERHNAVVLGHHVAALSPHVVSWWAMAGMSLSLIERVRRLGLPAVGVVADDWMLVAARLDLWASSCRAHPLLARLAGAVAGVPTSADIAAAASWRFVSRSLLEQTTGAGIQLPRAVVSHPGIDHRRFAPRPRPRWGWRMLYAGRIDPEKGIDTAVRSLLQLPEATLRIDGASHFTHREDLVALAAALSVSDRVRFAHSAFAEVPGLYENADAVVFPVRWAEPWGMVPLEAMAVGAPVVATGLGGSGEYLRHEDNCLLVPVDNPGALAAAVRRLADDPDLRDRLRAGGFATAAQFRDQDFNSGFAAAIAAAAGLQSPGTQ